MYYGHYCLCVFLVDWRQWRGHVLCYRHRTRKKRMDECIQKRFTCTVSNCLILWVHIACKLVHFIITCSLYQQKALLLSPGNLSHKQMDLLWEKKERFKRLWAFYSRNGYNKVSDVILWLYSMELQISLIYYEVWIRIMHCFGVYIYTLHRYSSKLSPDAVDYSTWWCSGQPVTSNSV